MLAGQTESISNQLSDAGIKSVAQVAAWNNMQSNFIYSNATTAKNIAKIKSIIQAVSISKATGSSVSSVLNSSTGKAISSTNLAFQTGTAHAKGNKAASDRAILGDLNKGALAKKQLEETTSKYVALTENPPVNSLFDFGSLFGNLGNVLPILLVAGGLLVAFMVVRK